MPTLDSPKHERFAQEYAKSGNATQSYISAGYSANGADAGAARLLGNVKVAARVTEITNRVAEAAIKRQISERSHRVALLQDMLDRMTQVVEARAQLLKDDPDSGGGHTGLIVRRERPSKFGSVIEYEADAGLLREIRAHMQQAAQELGQWTEKKQTDLNAVINSIPPETLAAMTDDELTSAIRTARESRKILARLGGGSEETGEAED